MAASDHYTDEQLANIQKARADVVVAWAFLDPETAKAESDSRIRRLLNLLFVENPEA